MFSLYMYITNGFLLSITIIYNENIKHIYHWLSFRMSYYGIIVYWIYYWLVISTPLKKISQLGLLFPTYGKIKFMFQTTNQIVYYPPRDFFLFDARTQKPNKNSQHLTSALCTASICSCEILCWKRTCNLASCNQVWPRVG